MLTDCVNQWLGLDTGELYHDRLDAELRNERRRVSCMTPGEVVPNPYHDAMCESALGEVGKPPTFKTHDLADLIERGNKFVYVFRAPAQAFLSYFFYIQQRWADGVPTIDMFCRQQLRNWCDHVRWALDIHGRCSDRILFVPYGRLLEPTQLAAAFTFLGLDFPVKVISKAVQRTRRFFEKLNGHEETRHCRGRNVEIQQYLAARTNDLIERRSLGLYQSANSIALAQLGFRQPVSDTRLCHAA